MDRSLFLPASKVDFTHMSQSHALVTVTGILSRINSRPGSVWSFHNTNYQVYKERMKFFKFICKRYRSFCPSEVRGNWLPKILFILMSFKIVSRQNDPHGNYISNSRLIWIEIKSFDANLGKKLFWNCIYDNILTINK